MPAPSNSPALAQGATVSPRPVATVITAHRQQEGAGFVVRRPVPTAGLQQVDPFLLLDELGPVDYAPGEAIGAPDHPHRGFETVTYVLEGEGEHEDSAGHRGVIRAGGVQWMTAGAGVVHSEMPSRRLQRDGGRMHGFQLWVNLPKRDKWLAPRYQEIAAAEIPEARSADGLATVRVIAGEALGARAVIDTRTPILYLHWELAPGAAVAASVPAAYSGFAFVFRGEARIGADGRAVSDGQMAILGPGGSVPLANAGPGPASLLLIAGVPLREPMVRWGPFVMNEWAEIEQAMEDFRAGRLGVIARDGA